MGSTLSWLDHDIRAADRSMRLLHLFKESEARDEFGIGGIRDAISDQLFPGTSTLHTRLRYVFFLPWLYSQLEERRTSSLKYQDAGKQSEGQLLQMLIRSAATRAATSSSCPARCTGPPRQAGVSGTTM
jgi:hypothetical protein